MALGVKIRVGGVMMVGSAHPSWRHMDLTAVTEVHHEPSMPSWCPGDAWLGGGTWLFSEPQPEITRLIDLTAFGWPALPP